MKKRIAGWLYRLMIRFVASKRRPDEIIEDEHGDPYMLRWWLVRVPQPHQIDAATGLRQRALRWRRATAGNLYLHCLLRSDAGRELHDHPWDWTSFILHGAYREHRLEAFQNLYDVDWQGADKLEITRKDASARFMTVIRDYSTGSLRSNKAEDAHRIELFSSKYHDCIQDFKWMTHAEAVSTCLRIKPVWTLFFTAPWRREWGFHTPEGWVHNQDFNSGDRHADS